MQREDLAHRLMPLNLPPIQGQPPAPASPALPSLSPQLAAPLTSAPTATATPGKYNNAGLNRDVFGFATYWELSSGDLGDVQYDKVSTFAYFGLTVNGSGGFDQDGGMTGWNSAALSSLIAQAHGAGDKVVVVAKQFNEATINTITSNSSVGQSAITSIISAMQSKGLDGVNIDFEGSISSSYPGIQQNFSSWMATLSQQLHAASPTAMLSVDTYSGSASWDGGFMNIGALQPSVDAFMVMAYDMGPGNAGAGQPPTLPNAPLQGNYTYNDTASVDQYMQKAPAQKIILGVPYYGYKYSTTNTSFNAPLNYGALGTGCVVSCSDTYSGIQSDFACGQQLVRAWDPSSTTPWAHWWSPASGDPCGANRGSVREVYYDDATSLNAKYNLVNTADIRGSGIWALGYDHGFAELWNVIASNYFGTPAPTEPAGTYQPLTPARILDTRNGTGGFTSPLGPGQSIDVQVSGQGGVPTSGVSAVVVNLTTTDSTAASFITLSPSGYIRPITSSVDINGPGTVQNLVEVELGQGGRLMVFNYAGSTDAVLDVEGYVASSGTGPAGLYNAIDPVRIADTRTGFGGARLGPGQSLTLQVAGSKQANGSTTGVPPTGVAAVVMNVTATGGAGGASFLTAYPTGVARPNASNINFFPGQTVPNRVMVPAGAAGQVTIYNNAGSVDVVVDVNGWFTSSTSAAGGGSYNAVAPQRLLDTRAQNPVGPQQNLPLLVAGTGQVPPMSATPAPKSVVLNVTVTAPTSYGYLTAFPAGSSLPYASDLNWVPGQTIANLVVVKLGPDGRVGFYNSAGSTQVVVDVEGWYS